MKTRNEEYLEMISELLKEAPCGGNLEECVGYRNCEFGSKGVYGTFCSLDNIEEVIKDRK